MERQADQHGWKSKQINQSKSHIKMVSFHAFRLLQMKAALWILIHRMSTLLVSLIVSLPILVQNTQAAEKSARKQSVAQATLLADIEQCRRVMEDKVRQNLLINTHSNG